MQQHNDIYERQIARQTRIHRRIYYRPIISIGNVCLQRLFYTQLVTAALLLAVVQA